ncbi:MAG: chloride channel protein, partial [Candidatus Sedimenticola endophacoides]
GAVTAVALASRFWGLGCPKIFHEVATLLPGLYALLGMGAMMGASLQAPLAALTAMMELTHSPQPTAHS